LKLIIGTNLKEEGMKKIIVFILIVNAFASCDPTSTTTYKIKNNTKNNIEIIFLSSIDVSDTVTISHQEVQTWKVDTHYGSPSAKMDLIVLYDSIMIKTDDLVIKTYKTQTLGKNIYNYDYWSEHKKKKRDYEYTFEITEDDIANNEDCK
jgi:hypothetical protein